MSYVSVKCKVKNYDQSMEYDPKEFHYFIDDLEIEVVKKHGLCANQIPQDPNLFERNEFVSDIIIDFIKDAELTLQEIREMIKVELFDKIGDVRRRINGKRPLKGQDRKKRVEELLLELCQIHDHLMYHFTVSELHLDGLVQLMLQTIVISLEHKIDNPVYIE